jgi:hypothetical protein
LIELKEKAHVIMHNGKIVGTYSPVARRVALEEIQRLTDPEEIAIYETHVSNIDKGRVRLNELLMTFNEEPVLSTEWGTLTTRDARLKRIEKKTRNFSFSEPISYVRKYELWAKNAGEPRLQDDFAENAPKVLETMKQIISGMNLDVKIDLLPWIEEDGQALAGKFILGERGVQVAYNAVPQLRPNLNRNDSLNYVLHHEVMHLLRTEGFFTKNEYMALEKAATDRWIKQYKIAERHPELDRATQIEEAISDAFAEYMTGRYQTGGPIAKAFNRLKQYLIALGNALTGNRFDTAANIFNAIDLGLVGARYESMQRTTDVYLTGDNATSIIVTNPYSGEDIRGFVPKTRALFTKQPNITNVKQFFKWFNSGGRPSAVVDTKGAPLIVYHITLDTRQENAQVPFTNFRDTADFGYHFTPDQNVIDYFKENQFIAGGEFVFKGFLNIKNPYRMPDMLSWDEDAMIAVHVRRWNNFCRENLLPCDLK